MLKGDFLWIQANFVSDGAKSDSANIQGIFSEDCVVAVQDPAYPVYVDGNVIAGRTGLATDSGYDGWFTCHVRKATDFFRICQLVKLI